MMLKIPIDGIRVRVEEKTLVIESERLLYILSSAALNGGFSRATTIINHQVGKNFSLEPRAKLAQVIRGLKLPESTIGLMTATNVDDPGIIFEEERGLAVCAMVTAGLSSNTVNTILLIDSDLTPSCMVNAVITATEGKCLALQLLGVEATGTCTDTVTIAFTGKGERIEYAGTATTLGKMIYNTVREATLQALQKQEQITVDRPIMQRLEELGITLSKIVETALTFFVPHPGIESGREARQIFVDELNNALADPNVSALIYAGITLERDAKRGMIPDLKGYENDLAALIADEVLGMSIANYIGGYKGLFEYIRFDKAKPGILTELGPFMDDVIAGLIGGVSAKMYDAGMRAKEDKDE
ncbi:MAG: phosphatidylglycerophosphatase A [Methanosarcinales archaeon Met12]|nr:MAG: phosphatidylglycerophosphatase A [Methanosarcinales archaeon Met12]